ncbi:DUF885 domain-containing protein [Actinoplanes friuliensis]|uniref:DUF885 domain-containing protein n=1 Tax=Actinoplanes friuliensis TaxID=196914 RepID=UPI0011DD7C2A|nr:DUF885 domain-containing protein [Actinoplanes friuliensis]
MQWTPVWAVLGALIGATGTYLGVVRAQRETLKRELEVSRWRLSADTYVELLNWTGWVQHWFVAGAPDPHERPLTVDMARIAARLRAFGDTGAADKASELFHQLRPEVSAQNISGKAPPGDHIRVLAEQLTELAGQRLSITVVRK